MEFYLSRFESHFQVLCSSAWKDLLRLAKILGAAWLMPHSYSPKVFLDKRNEEKNVSPAQLDKLFEIILMLRVISSANLWLDYDQQ